jgi:SAM-dependent methyltransferase
MADLKQYRASALEQARAADLLRIHPAGRATVLDIGAREGFFSRLLAAHFDSVTALDLEKPSFDYPRVTTVAGDVSKLDFPSDAFDCIFCTEVLEHISNVEKACREIVRVTRYELVIGVPFEQDIRVGRVTCGACGKAGPRWGHVNSFDERRLLELFVGCRLLRKSFVGTTKEATNVLSSALMDMAGNPWGTYDEELQCPFCGAGLRKPTIGRTLGSKVCSALAHRINSVQSLFSRPHANWIHLVFSKQRAGQQRRLSCG